MTKPTGNGEPTGPGDPSGPAAVPASAEVAAAAEAAGAAGAAPGSGPMHCYRHPERETYVTCVRCGRPICPQDMYPASVGFQCPEEMKEVRREARGRRTPMGGRLHAGRDVTTALIAINVVMLIITTASGSSLFGSSTSKLFDELALVPARLNVIAGGRQITLSGVAGGQYYRLFTSMFLHFGLLHIAFNMYALYVIGPPLERILGRGRYLSLYLIAGLGGAGTSLVLGPSNEVGAGASGAIFGLFGAYYIIARRLGADTGAIAITIVVNLVISRVVPNIDIHAHIGGLITGGLVAIVFTYAPRDRQTTWQVAGCVALLVIIAVASVVRADDLHNRDNREFNGARAPIVSTVASPHEPTVALSGLNRTST